MKESSGSWPTTRSSASVGLLARTVPSIRWRHAAWRCVVAILLGCSVGATSAQPAAVCPDGKPVDAVQRVGDHAGCLVVRRIEPARATSPVLVVFLHGDSGARTDLGDDRSVALALSSRLGAVAYSLQRPGYESPSGHSDGQTSAAGDDYSTENIALVARGLQSLRKLNPGKRILLVGYSGGAATAALLANRHAGSADGYLLAACPCDLASWRQWRASAGHGSGDSAPWSRSLSPLNEVAGIKPDVRISVVVGAKDENTLPKFSEAYVGALQGRGVKTRLTYAAGATHVSVVRSPEFFMLADDLAGRLAR